MRFGGTDEKAIDPEKLMSKISVVFQDVYLFQDTIESNIRYGKENATHEAVNLAILGRICRVLGCDYGDIMEYVDETETENI